MDRDEIVSDAHEKIHELIEYDLRYLEALANMLDIDQNALHRFYIKCHITLYGEATGAYEGMGS